MRFDIDENVLLRVSGTAAVALSAYSALAPRDFHNNFMLKTASISEPTLRYHGTVGMMVGADHLILSAKDGLGLQDTKKDVLKNPTQPKEIAAVNAIGQGILGSLCLIKGFEKKGL